MDERVTAKIQTNLRRKDASTEKDEDVVATICNGDWIETGIGHVLAGQGEYNGQVLYAVITIFHRRLSSSSVPTYQKPTTMLDGQWMNVIAKKTPVQPEEISQ